MVCLLALRGKLERPEWRGAGGISGCREPWIRNLPMQPMKLQAVKNYAVPGVGLSPGRQPSRSRRVSVRATLDSEPSRRGVLLGSAGLMTASTMPFGLYHALSAVVLKRFGPTSNLAFPDLCSP